jgi:L-ascorbate metabolism protein UlaG (beta-lactamase superfamily)
MPDIQYLGRGCVRIRGKDGILICDPFPRGNGFDPGRPTAQIVTLSTTDPLRVSPGVVKPQRESVFVIDGPGEYEVGGIMIDGIRTYRDADKGAQLGHNTIYVFMIDEMKFCHLGELGHDLTTRQLEEIGTVDVLFVPAFGALGHAKLTELIAAIEPRAVIPLYESAEQLDRLAHELGLKEWEAQEKITVTGSALPGADEETRIIILRPGTLAA